LRLRGEKIAHFMGLAFVNLYFYVSEISSEKFEPQSTLELKMSACDWTRKSEYWALTARKLVNLGGLSRSAEGNYVPLVRQMWIVLSKVGR